MNEKPDCKYIFFGAGQMGKTLAQFWIDCGEPPAYFVDNDCRLWGQNWEDIRICPPEKICSEDEEYRIIISCSRMDEISCQLKSYGISSRLVIRADELWQVLPDIWRNKKPCSKSNNANAVMNLLPKVLFDLQGGLALGGIEAWSFQLSKRFRAWGISAEYLILSTCERLVTGEEQNAIELDVNGNKGIKTELELVSQACIKNTPCCLVCNFTRSVFWGMCYAKHMDPENIRLIAVIHNDEDRYYSAYARMERYIDFCIVLSDQMEKKILEKGFPKKKIRHMSWNIPYDKVFGHKYSAHGHKLHIGYAGRITVRQKRSDFLPAIIEKLMKKKVEFVFEIAGEGDYQDAFLDVVEKKKITDQVLFHGYLPREEIPAFWKRQDIMVSCSDWEGHSITQVEAMAAGAVPIVTDVSGARDDIADGENGFVVEIGAVDQIVEKICFLHEHRELLPIMGRKAHETIRAKCDATDMEGFWKSMLM